MKEVEAEVQQVEVGKVLILVKEKVRINLGVLAVVVVIDKEKV
jgi:hypothetical protein